MDKKQIRTITEYISRQDMSKVSPYLYNGKMGLCISLFAASRYLKDDAIEEKAKSSFDDVCNECEKNYISNKVSLGYGLAGLSLGFTYLAINKYIDSDPEDVLEDFDNTLFRLLSSKTRDELLNITTDLFGILFYLLYSVKNSTKKDSEVVQLKKELIIQIINTIESFNDQNGYTQLTNEPFIFDMTAYKFPAYLYMIAEIYKLGFYDYKLDRIIDSLTTFIQSSFPRLISNRIYLLLCARHLINVKPIPEWEEHLKLLENSVDIKAMLKYEFKDKSININNGVSGLLLLLLSIPETILFSYSHELMNEIMEKICKSSYFDTTMKEKKDFAGVISGSCGIVLALSLYGLFKEKT